MTYHAEKRLGDPLNFALQVAIVFAQTLMVEVDYVLTLWRPVLSIKMRQESIHRYRANLGVCNADAERSAYV